MSDTPPPPRRQTADERAREHLRANRPALRANLPQTDAELRQLTQDRASAVTGLATEFRRTTDAPVAIKPPLAARVALGAKRVFNPKIHDKDVAKFKPEKFDALAFIRRCDSAIDAEREPGEVRAVYLKAVVRIIAWGAARSGKYEKTFRLLAKLGACCVETTRKSIRWLETHRLIDTMNPLAQAGRDLHRGPNVYLPLLQAPPEASAAGPPVAPELAPLARATETLNRWAHRFGMVARDWGLNATPMASKRSRRRSDPTPA